MCQISALVLLLSATSGMAATAARAPEVRTVIIKSSADGTAQSALFFVPPGAGSEEAGGPFRCS